MTRTRSSLVLAVLALAALVTALVLVHGAGHQTILGSMTDETDPDAVAVETSVRVQCASAASGPLLGSGGYRDGLDEVTNAIAEDDTFALDYQGIDLDEVSDVCGRVRTERLTHAGELGVLGVLLGGSAVLLFRDRRRVPRESVAPSSGRDPRTGAEI